MKLAANRMMKILDQAKRLAPQSVTGALSPVQERTMQQAEALMAHPATSRLSQSALERPKTLFDHYVSVQPRPQGNLHDLLAEASNPATSAARLGELASTPFREVVEAAAVNPNAGAELSRVHQLRPDLAEKNPATALMRMMDPLSSPPKMNEWEMRAFKSDLRSKGNRRFHENLWDHVFTQRPLRIGNERVEARTDHKDMLGGRRPGRPGWNISTLSDPGSRALQALERSPRSQELESLRFPSEKRAFLREKTAAPKTAAFVAQRPLPPVGSVQEALQGTRGIEGLFASAAANPQLAAELPPGKRGVLFTRNLEETRKHLADALKIPVEQVNERVAELIRRSTMRHELTHAMRERAGKMEGFGKPGLRNVLRSYREEGIASMEGLRALENLKAHQTNPELVAQIATGTLPGIQTSVQHAYKPHGGILRGALSGSLKPLLPIAERLGVLTKKAAAKNVTFAGVPVRIDRPKGFVQKGVGPDGNVRYRTYHADYGYIPGTKGGDGEGFDVFLGPKENGRAFLIHQKKDDGTFDEFKLMLGYADPQSAKAMYLKHIPQKYMGSFQEVPVAMIQGLRGKEVNHKQIMMKKAEAVWDSFFDNIE